VNGLPPANRVEAALSFLRSEEVQGNVMTRFELRGVGDGKYVASGNGLTRTMSADEVIEEASKYKFALQRSK